MKISPFHAMYIAAELSALSHNGEERLIPAYASADIEVYPYQIAAAMFALRSPYLKGAVLADEGSLGKTYESLLVISELYFEGRDRILLIVPTPLLRQWIEIMDGHFSVPFTVVDRDIGDKNMSKVTGNPFDTGDVVLTTCEYAAENAEFVGQIVWNIVVFEEAHRLSKAYTGENKTATTLKDAVGSAFKLLLTATPMQNSIMDLYGLITFIDENALGDADTFYKRYFRKPELYGELTSVASRYCFRTLRSQVDNYVKIPRRIPVTADYKLTGKETELAALLDAYLIKPEKQAFPKMDTYELTMMLTRTLSSSTFAFEKLLRSAVERAREPELVNMLELAANITVNVKGQELLKALKIGFAGLKKLGANCKALIFTENRATQKYLSELLTDAGYNTLTYSGDKSRDYDIIKRFETEAEILIATDVAAEGFNFAFCSFVVNYDMPYNILTLEQRIMRCHRQGQQNDMIVLNFLNKGNFADVRMLELINKRVLQFDGVMGMSDDIIGNFSDNAVDGLVAAFGMTRHKNDIESEYRASLAEHEDTNTTSVREAENALFTTFTRDIADKVTVTPQYIKDKAIEINEKLWTLTKWFFDGKIGYDCVDETRTVIVGVQPQKVFTGVSLRRREYSMSDKTHTLMGTLAKNIIAETFWRGIPDEGTISVKNLEESLKIGYYRVVVQSKDGGPWGGGTKYYGFVGKTASGRFLSDEECRAIMGLPVVNCVTKGDTYGERDGISKQKRHDDLDDLVDLPALIRRAAMNTDAARREEANAVQDRAYRQKQALDREIELLKNELNQIENGLSRTASVAERVDAEKRKASASRDLKRREQSLFMDGLRIDVDAEEAVKRLTDEANLTAEAKRLFMITAKGER